MFKMKKVGEYKKPSIPPPKQEKKKHTIEKEQINDRFSILNDIDALIR